MKHFTSQYTHCTLPVFLTRGCSTIISVESHSVPNCKHLYNSFVAEICNCFKGIHQTTWLIGDNSKNIFKNLLKIKKNWCPLPNSRMGFVDPQQEFTNLLCIGSSNYIGLDWLIKDLHYLPIFSNIFCDSEIPFIIFHHQYARISCVITIETEKQRTPNVDLPE